MMNHIYKIILYVFSLLLVFSSPMSAFAADDLDSARFARGAQQWANNCDRCHNMRDPREFRDDLWGPIIAHMRIRGGLTGQQARDILYFLQSSNYSASAQSE